MDLHNPRVDVVLFDVGNVLIQLNYDRIFELWAQPGAHDPKALRAKFKLTESFYDYERGTLSTAAYTQSLNTLIGTDLNVDEFRRGWNAIFDGEIPGMSRLLDDIANHARLFAFSNTNVDHVAHFPDYDDILHRFETVYVSNDVGERKPDVAAYRKVVNDIGVDPGRVLFLDDLQDNVRGAIDAGLHAVQFVDAVRARLDVSRYLAIPSE